VVDYVANLDKKRPFSAVEKQDMIFNFILRRRDGWCGSRVGGVSMRR
jgi:hypothetical protein